MSRAPQPLPWSKRLLLRLLNVYPPFLGARIRVRRTREGGFETRMRLVAWNRNFVGTHFGGSLYAMTDPFYVLLLYERLGPDYVIWNRAATIEFLHPGRGLVTARFQIPESRLAEIRQTSESGERMEPRFDVEIFDGSEAVVARIVQTLSIRRRRAPTADT